MAVKKGCTSIAFPAIGIGGLQYDLDVVADQMFASVYNCKEVHGKLQRVTFVIYSNQYDKKPLKVQYITIKYQPTFKFITLITDHYCLT